MSRGRVVAGIRLALLLWLALALVGPALAKAPVRSAVEQARIEHLIAAVATLDGAVFIRNGDEHNAAAAASHLREKLDYAGARIATAEQFITECATRSWLSKRPYRIRLGDGREVDSAGFFRQRLAAYDSRQTPAPKRGAAAGTTPPPPSRALP